MAGKQFLKKARKLHTVACDGSDPGGDFSGAL